MQLAQRYLLQTRPPQRPPAAPAIMGLELRLGPDTELQRTAGSDASPMQLAQQRGIVIVAPPLSSSMRPSVSASWHVQVWARFCIACKHSM